MDRVYQGDYGFPLEFISDVDLSAMTNVRMLIIKNGGSTDTYDFPLQAFNTVQVGETLSYQTRPSDLTVPGRCVFQVIAKDGIADIAFKPLKLFVERRIVPNSWG